MARVLPGLWMDPPFPEAVMFDVAPAELLLVGLVALIVIGPKELPALMRQVGYWVGKMRKIIGDFRGGIDEMMRQAELEERDKAFREAVAARERSESMREEQKAAQAAANAAGASEQ